ncbi:MAG: acyltransferase [Firmicutes bacterium]|nr:acyltransferase [Bacillota bacterium]
MPGLDGLRALAVFAVLFYHLGVSWAPGGLLGVGVFFTLSGYLITDLLLGQIRHHGRILFGDFYFRRAKRLLPALYVMLALVLFYITLFQRDLLSSLPGDVLAAVFYVSNWWYIYHHVSYFQSFIPSPFTNLWSLAVEEQFYLIWPLILIVFAKTVRSPVVRVIITLILAGVSALLMGMLYHPGTVPNLVYYGTDTRAFALLIGAALAFVWPSTDLPKVSNAVRDAITLLGVAGLGLFVWMVLYTNEYETFMYRGGMVLLAVGTMFLVQALTIPDSLLSMVLGSKPFRWVGVRSYAMYLWHYPIIVLSSGLLLRLHGNHLIYDTVITVATLAVSALSWHFVENPIRRIRVVTRPRGRHRAGAIEERAL